MRAHSNTAIGNSESPKVITVSINGASRQFPRAISIAELIEEMGLTGKRIALERNGEIVPRSTFAAQQIADGDRMEIVVAVGGG
ncbi:thiamine biosynthesis protein ThiS [Ferrigenium kumadai]|uniref:Thiamine biosynthesis protein ThiS n=1 Tax=Ferrigenium kumadai TaxID=1682490 RepID=A0AAN1W112_9PROT|nr:thiamine biosynthesis protein ThiS [Ferrigenium kumadai]